MVLRKIIEIDEELCDGCGECIPNCEEGALQIIEGKAKMVSETYCDGLGDCVESCPNGAITIIEKVAEPYDEKTVGNQSQSLKAKDIKRKDNTQTKEVLRNFPVKLKLVSVNASFFDESSILFVADCVPFIYKDFHTKAIQGKILLSECPKFDNAKKYVKKLSQILTQNNVNNISTLSMEIPCCAGLSWIVERALMETGEEIQVSDYKVNLRGDIDEL